MVTPQFLNTKNVLLVDGHNLAIRILFSVNKGNTTLSQPEIIQECCTIFMHQIAICIRKYTCERVYIAFDNGGSIRKKSLFEEYKQNRPTGVNYGQVSAFNDTSTDLFVNLKTKLLLLCQMLNLPVFHEYGIEADDFLGIATKELTNIGKQVIILSNDSDFLQLLKCPSVVCSIPYNKSEVTLESFPKYISSLPKTKGLTISSFEYLFYKVIVGDSSDNIDGIKGIGYKTLNKLMTEQLPNETRETILLYMTDGLDYIKLLASRNGTKLERLMHDNLDLLIRNYKLIELSERYISPKTVSMTLKKLMEVPEAPDRKVVIAEFHRVFSGHSATEFLLNTLFALKPIYHQEVV